MKLMTCLSLVCLFAAGSNLAFAANKPEVKMLTEATKKTLVKKAQEARSKAYAPYSKFKVGAALIGDDGKIYTGGNIENASYGMCICAERTAIFKAISEGVSNIQALAVVVPGGGTPCGACRQVMNEFNPNMTVIYGDLNGNVIGETTLQTILPDAFGPHNLEKNIPCD